MCPLLDQRAVVVAVAVAVAAAAVVVVLGRLGRRTALVRAVAAAIFVDL